MISLYITNSRSQEPKKKNYAYSVESLCTATECSYGPMSTVSKLAASLLCSTETTRSTGLVKKKTLLKGTRPHYLPLVCQAGGAQPHRGKFT
jgi:hypothetical protein